jgi:hypothetical protein
VPVIPIELGDQRFDDRGAGNVAPVRRRPTVRRTLVAAGLWPFGIGLTSWHYLWRTTPMHRSESPGSGEDAAPPLPHGFPDDDLQDARDGVGPLFHRRYEVRIRGTRLSPEEVIHAVACDPNCAAPTEFARFHRLEGASTPLRQNDELLVHMPGPWNGPVRVVEVTPLSLRLATLAGHLEAGQIEFAAERDGDLLRVRIESWARSGDRVSNVLYQHLRMAKEVQLHMWSSFLERIAELAGGRLVGGITIVTRRLEDGDAAR